MNRKKKKKQQYKNTSKNPDYIVYTDGGCAFNPGGPGGIGAVIIDCETGEILEISKGYTSTTNNRMEIMAILEACRMIPGNGHIQLYSDSQYVLNCIAGLWEKRKNTDLWTEFRHVCKGKTFDLCWIRGHSGNRYNERCDELAASGINRADSIPDTGYLQEKQAGREFYERAETHFAKEHPGGAMRVDICIPDGLCNEAADIRHPKEYAKEHGIHDSCARAIWEFSVNSRKTFREYMSLKTGGIDSWSRKKIDVLIREDEDRNVLLDTIAQYVGTDKAVMSVLRWRARGLSLADAIRKVLVDQKVEANCQH